MRKKSRRLFLLVLAGILAAFALSGCEPSKKKVTSSSYYKELKKKYKKLKKENRKLKAEVEAEDDTSADEQRVTDYLEKISRDRLVKLEVGYADNMDGSEFIGEEFFPIATAIAKRADVTTKYTQEDLEDRFGSGYEYILYDENNAIYEIMVYEGDYVVFTDLPESVFYAYNASALGEAILHYKNGYPNSSLLHRLADAAIVTDDKGNAYENDVAFSVANAIDQMEKKKSSEEAARKSWAKASSKKKSKKASDDETAETTEETSGESSEEDGTETDAETAEPKSRSYTFYHHGNQLTLTLYKKYFYIENMDGERTWYKAAKADIKALKKLFVQRFADEQEESSADTESETDTQSHLSEIEAESSGRTD